MVRAAVSGSIKCQDLREKILAADLCSGCGACVGVCPVNALSFPDPGSHIPVLDEDLCLPNCSLCYKVCPGKGYPVTEWARQSCESGTTFDPWHGPVRGFYKGFSTDDEIRLESASGGVATALMLHLLRTGEVEAVGVVNMENGYATAQLTADPKVILSAQTSKYSPVPMMKIIRELNEHPRPIALTVTPCQLAALKYALKSHKKLRDCIVLTIGLFCGQVKDYRSTTAIADSLGIQYPGEANFMGWRCGAYPGSARFELPDGTIRDKPLYEWLDISVPHFSLRRCVLCPDGGNWLSDITLGDIHSGGTDQTVIVSRTKNGEDHLEAARRAGEIEFQPLDNKSVTNCVIQQITRSKMIPALSAIEFHNRKKLRAPEFDYPQEVMNSRAMRMSLFWVWKYRLYMGVRKRWIHTLLSRYSLLEKTGHFLYKFPFTIPGFKTAIKLAKKVSG